MALHCVRAFAPSPWAPEPFCSWLVLLEEAKDWEPWLLCTGPQWV